MEQSLYQGRPNLDNIPDDIASILAEQIFEWGEVSRDKFGFAGGNAGWPLIPERDEEEKRAESIRNSSIRSLFFLDRRSKDVWYRFLLRHVHLRSGRLSSILSLLEKEPHLGQHIHHLSFSDETDKANWKLIPPEMYTNANGEEPLYDAAGFRMLYDWFSSDQVISHLFSSSKESKKLSMILHQGGSDPKTATLVSRRLLMLARAKIIDFCTNLQSLSFEGFDTDASFIKRVGKDNTLLGGLKSSSLKSINFGRQGAGGMRLSLENVGFLLLNLQHLSEANLEAFMDRRSSRFFRELLEVKDDRHSNIKQLTLELQIHVEADDQLDRLCERCINSILSFTKKLEVLSMKFLAKKPVDLPTIHLFEGGLQDLGLASLDRCELRGVKWLAEMTADTSLVADLSSIKTFAVDSIFLETVFLAIVELTNGDLSLETLKSTFNSNFSILPRNMEHLIILSNYSDPSAGSNRYQPEWAALLAMELLPENSPLTCISTPTLPRCEEDKIHLEGLKNRDWAETREDLENFCLRRRLKLDQVDLLDQEKKPALRENPRNGCEHWPLSKPLLL